jgi:glyoxylase-like metal-dependent hydrolase (beta-lactamase superfamily II)
MRELQTGLWHWEARHPDWTEADHGPDGWGPDVSSYAVDNGKHLLLIDPLAPPSLVDELAAGREPVVVLTCPWHRRDARRLREELGATVFVPPPDNGDTDPIAGQIFSAGDTLPVGVEAFPGRDRNDLVLWIESRRVLAAGDTLVDRGRGLELPVTWLPEGVTREQAIETLRPLLELPVELVLPAHGAPADRAALERALA